MDLTALHKIQYGMFIVTAARAGALNGQIANTVFQVSADPVTIAISINKLNLTHEYIAASQAFGITILSESAPMPFIGTFGFKSGRTIDKFKNVRSRLGVTGAPLVLDHAAAVLEARVIGTHDVATHTLFIGSLVAAEAMPGAPPPMTYAYYHTVKGGLTQKYAPTYTPPAT